MKRLAWILIGIGVGGVVLGSWLSWASPIQSQVGINGFNGINWQAIRSGSNTGTISGSANGNLNTLALMYGSDGGTANWVRSTISPSTVDDMPASISSLNVQATLYGFDNVGTNFDRLISNRSDIDGVPVKSAGILETGSKIFGFNDALNGWTRIRSTGTNLDGLATSGVNDFGLLHTKSFLYGFNGTTFDRLRSDITNGLDVDVTRVSGTVTVAGANTPSDAFANPTNAVPTQDFLMGYNGTTFDRLRSDITNGLDVDVTRVSGTVTVAGGNTIADNFANPTNAVPNQSFSMGWDGTNWDRLFSDSTNSDDLSTVTQGALHILSHTAEFDGTNFDRIRHSFTQTTSGVAANGAGTSITETTTPMSKHTMIVDRTAGATNTVDIRIECSIDNTDFVQIASITDLTNEPALVSQNGTPCFYIRYDVITIGAGNTVQIHLLDTR